jgi:hypothetical protein
MFTTMREVVEATKEKYKAATSLSKDRGEKYYNCRYAHDANGIGCAIGCHLTAENALVLQRRNLRISTFLYDPDGGEAAKVLSDVFDLDEIDVDDLTHLQIAHDNSETVEQFLQKLDKYLSGRRVWWT